MKEKVWGSLLAIPYIILFRKEPNHLLPLILQSFCAGFGGTLASVHNIWEYQFLQRMVKTAGHAFAWIGGYYFEVRTDIKKSGF